MWADEAARDADLVIVSIPQKNTPPDLAAGIVDARKPGAPVIETNNYYPQQRDGKIEAIENGTPPESVWVSEHIGAPVYKVFNGIYWKHLLKKGVPPAGAEGRIALPVAGDDADGKKIVFGIVDELGFDPVDAGPLAESWRQQPGTPVYGKDFGVDDTLAALKEPRRNERRSGAPPESLTAQASTTHGRGPDASRVRPPRRLRDHHGPNAISGVSHQSRSNPSTIARAVSRADSSPKRAPVFAAATTASSWNARLCASRPASCPSSCARRIWLSATGFT